MKYYISFIILAGFTFCQSSSTSKRNEIITERHENGIKKTVMVFEGEGLSETKVAEYGFYANGLKSYIKNFNNNSLNGKSIEWHENGNKSFEGHFKNNKKDGLHQYWFDKGTPQYSMNYL